MFHAVFIRIDRWVWPRTRDTRWNRTVFRLASRGSVLPAVVIMAALAFPIGAQWAKFMATPAWYGRLDLFLAGFLAFLFAVCVSLRASLGLSLGRGFVLQPNVRRGITRRPRGTLHLDGSTGGARDAFRRTELVAGVRRAFGVLGHVPGTELVLESPLVASERMRAWLRRNPLPLDGGRAIVVTEAGLSDPGPWMRAAYSELVAFAAAEAQTPIKDRSRNADGTPAPWGRVRFEVVQAP